MLTFMEEHSIRECMTAANRYWEPRRVLYNVILAAALAGRSPKFSPVS
jgi:hypothetical protein